MRKKIHTGTGQVFDQERPPGADVKSIAEIASNASQSAAWAKAFCVRAEETLSAMQRELASIGVLRERVTVLERDIGKLKNPVRYHRRPLKVSGML